MIARGRLVAFDTPENLEKQLRSAQQIRLTARAGEEKLREIAETVAGSSVLSASADADGYTSLVALGEGADALMLHILGAGFCQSVRNLRLQLLASQALGLAHEMQVLPGTFLHIHRGLLGQIADAFLCLFRLLQNVEAAHGDFALRLRQRHVGKISAARHIHTRGACGI